MSIELSPGNLGLSKGFDMSFASSTRSSQSTSFQPNTSVASSTDSSVFNTKGGVSPTTAFCSRKVGGSFSYQYRESEDEKRPIAADLAASTTFHLTGLIGNGQTSSRGGGGGGLNQSRAAKSGRKLSAPDEYAELVTTTNAHGNVDHLMHPRGSPMREMVMQADFTQSGFSQNELEVSMGPDGDNFNFVASLPVKRAPGMAVRASDESLGPDSPLARSGRRPGLAYDALSSVSRDKRSALRHQQMGTEVDLNAMSTVSFLSESSISSTSTSDSLTTSLHVSAYEPCMPLLQQLSSAGDSDYGEEIVSDRVSLASSEDAKMARSGSLIALKLEANSGSSEIAI
uniref:Uncharacterized protein n=1 Tax=Hyaloperonospora arabidopsidis (strain Emoy2) TaxID=559515 RepID=M4BW63_HYAAE